MRLLIIDDDRNDQKLLTRNLKSSNLKIDHFDYAASVADGLDKLKNNKYDFLILDYNLPDGNAANLVNSEPYKIANLPAIVVTGGEIIKDITKTLVSNQIDLISKDRLTNVEYLVYIINKNMLLADWKNERTSLINKLEEKNRELTEFSYHVAHDLKTPLNGMLLLSELLMDEDENKDEILENMIRLTVTTRNIIDDLLKYASFDNKEIVLEEIDINEIFEELKIELNETINQYKANISLINDKAKVLSDKVILKQILRNLISNSLKYSKPNSIPILKICIIQSTNAWQLVFSDNGIGMNASESKNFFISFKRLSNKGNVEGTGLGGAIIKKGVEKLNGEIFLTSVENEGTTFEMKFTTTKN